MLVKYFIQTDKEKDLNAFTVNPSSQELTVGDIKRQLPIKGNVLLRFKTLLQEENPPVAVWLDKLDDFAPAPTFNDQILIKVLYIPPFTSPLLQKSQQKIYKDFKSPSKHTNHAQSVRKVSDFLIMEEPHVKNPERSHSARPVNPVMGFEFPSIAEPHKKYVDPTDGLTTEQLKKRAEERINQKVHEKTQGVKKIWEEEENMRISKQDATREFSEKLDRWESRNHQKNNIRSLLATMHNVLWKDSGWEPIGPGDLMTPAQIKAAYFKSLNIIHPDKHENDPPSIRYISERVFAAVNAAFKLFRTNS